MANRYAVGLISFFDNELKIEIIEAETPLEALLQHSEIAANADNSYFADCATLEEAKQAAFDCDEMVDVVEIPNG